MDFYKTTEQEISKKTEIMMSNQFAFDSSYSIQGPDLKKEVVQIRRFYFTQPSQVTSKGNLNININYPVKEIVY